MSCFTNYLPQPPRDWSRVQNSCTYIDSASPQTFLVADMLNKGNVLQYKKNSSNFTKAQIYAKIARKQWTNRNTTWATQSVQYSNPNTTSLKRSGNVTKIAIDPITGAVIGETFNNVTCPQPTVTNNEVLPSNGGGGSSVNEPSIPPIIEPSSSINNDFPPIQEEPAEEDIVIQDGGSLICSVQENICTGEIVATKSQQLFNPTTDSDVPGPIQELFWNDGIQTWYPRQRYIMTNSGNKWPTNAVLRAAGGLNT
jgi:hypothetical protein